MPEWIQTLTVACSGGYRHDATGIGIVVQERGAGGGRGPATRHVSEAHSSMPAGDAESFAILRALELALEQGYTQVQVRSSSNGLRKRIRSAHRDQQCAEAATRAQILQLARQFAWIDFRWVPRRKNQTARRLARDAWEILRSEAEPIWSERQDECDEVPEATEGQESGFFENDDDAPDSIPF